MSIKRQLIIPMLAGILMLGGLTACEEEGPMERAGERIDETAENLGEKAEEATEGK